MDWKQFKFCIDGWDDVFIDSAGYVAHVSCAKGNYELALLSEPHGGYILLFSTVKRTEFRPRTMGLSIDKQLDQVIFRDLDPLAIRCTALYLIEQHYPQR